jgi:hypothetical protein
MRTTFHWVCDVLQLNGYTDDLMTELATSTLQLVIE